MASSRTPKNCSELDATVAKIALNYAKRPGVSNLDDVVREIHGAGIEIERAAIAAAIGNFARRETIDAIDKVRSATAQVKLEARTEQNLANTIDELREQIDMGHVPELAGRERESVNKTITALRKQAKRVRREAGLHRAIQDLVTQIETGDFKTRSGIHQRLDPKLQSLVVKRDLLRREADRGIERLRPKSFGEKAIGVANIPRAVMTSMDFSGVGRQGAVIMFSRPGMTAKGLAPMVRSFFSVGQARKTEQKIKARRNYELAVTAGLEVTQFEGGTLSTREEAFQTPWVERIPGVAGSSRAYTMFLTKLRMDMFDFMAEKLARTGRPTSSEAKAIANYINIATGRGYMGRLAPGMELLNTVFWSPRNVTARLQYIAGQPLWKSGNTARTRKLIAQEYMRTIIGFTTVLAMAAMAGAEIEWDLRSSDFIKLRFGNVRVDVGAGMGQMLVFMSRMIKGEAKSLRTGRVYRIRRLPGKPLPYGRGDAGDAVWRFIRSKFAPVPASVMDLFAGQDVIGRQATLPQEALDLFVPFSFRDIVEAAEKEGLDTAAMIAPLTIMGFNIQTFDVNQPVSRRR